MFHIWKPQHYNRKHLQMVEEIGGVPAAFKTRKEAEGYAKRVAKAKVLECYGIEECWMCRKAAASLPPETGIMNEFYLKRFTDAIADFDIDTFNPNDCWIRTLGGTRYTYGHFAVGGKIYPSQNVSVEHWVGPVPPGSVVDHLCAIPACVNPDHLEAVTPAENSRRGSHGTKTVWDKRSKDPVLGPPPAGRVYCVRGHIIQRGEACGQCRSDARVRSRLKRASANGQMQMHDYLRIIEYEPEAGENEEAFSSTQQN